MEFNLDILLIAFMLLGLIIGVIQGWYKTTIAVLLIVCGLYVTNFYFADYIINFVNYDLLDVLVDKGIMEPITINIEEAGLTFRVETIHEALLLTQNLGIDPGLIRESSNGLIASIVLLVGFVAVTLVIQIVATILYWILFRWIMPKCLRKGFLPHLIGAVLGVGAGFVGGITFIGLLGQFVFGIDAVLPQFMDPNSDVVALIASAANVETSQIVNYATEYGPLIRAFNPLSETSPMVKSVFNSLSNMGLSPLDIVTTERIDPETGETIKEAYCFTWKKFLEDLASSASKLAPIFKK